MAGEKIRSLQILRCVAVMMVLWLHAQHFAHMMTGGEPDPAGRYRDIGADGVDIFFLISGAIIYRIAFVDRHHSPAEFLKRRYLRIAPLYYLVSIFSLPFCAWLAWPTDWQFLATNFLFWPAWRDYVFPTYGIGWTLSYEMLFYCAATLALSWRGFLPILLAGYAIAFFLRFIFWPIVPLHFLGNPLIAEFLIGAAIASLSRRIHVSAPVALWFVGAACFAFYWLCLQPLGGEVRNGVEPLNRLILVGIPAAFMLFGALGLEAEIPQSRWIDLPVFLGDASYSIYLVHLLPFSLIASMDAFSPALYWPIFFGLIIVGLVLGLLCHVHIERPLNALTKGLQLSRPSAASTLAQAERSAGPT